MKLLKEFKQFAMRGNVIDLAIGVILGGAFGKITNSIVNDILMPVLGIFLGKVDFNSFYIPLDGGIYANITDAKNHTAVIAYGTFITTVIDFLILALSIFFLTRWMNKLARLKEKEPQPKTKKTCPFCKSEIEKSATRCAFCTSVLETA